VAKDGDCFYKAVSEAVATGGINAEVTFLRDCVAEKFTEEQLQFYVMLAEAK
jgi:hypothetical protein